MKILMVNKYLYPKGGAETYFLKIGSYLSDNGNEVQYFGMEDKKNTVTNQLGLYSTNMDFHKKGLKQLLYPAKIIYSFEAKRKIRSIIRDFKPDVIHLNNINFQLTPSIIDAAHKEGVPVVQTVHDYQMLCPNHLLYNIYDKVPCEICLKKSKWNCTKHKCIHYSKLKSILGSIEGVLYQKKKTYSYVTKYICPSYFLEKKLLTNPIYKDKTVTIHNFIDLKETVREYKKDNYVLYFGRLSEEKGFELFIECCKELKDIHFIIAGTGPLESLCENIPNVEFVGFKTGEQLDELIGKALCSVYPSIWYENCPLSILESQSLGTPVIGTKLGGVPELIKDGSDGVLLDKISKEELKAKIRMLYEDRALRERMSKNCMEKRAHMITLKNYCEELQGIYQEAVKC